MRRLWCHGKVDSMARPMRRCEAVGVENETIVFLGTDQEALTQNWDEIIDLEGRQVLPGFSDTHMHLLYYVLFQKNLALFGVDSIESIIRMGRERIAQNHPACLLGMGWNQEHLAEGRMPERRDLDRISTEIPICLLRVCADIAACNTAMVERLTEIRDQVPTAVWEKVDVEHGFLREEAMRLYMEIIPPENDQEIRDMIRSGAADLNAAGITCVHSDDLQVLSGTSPAHLVELFRELERDGELTVRVYEQCLVEPEDFEAFQALRSDPGDRTSLFRTGPRKLLQDGSLGAKSAEMIAGYVDEPDNHGIPIHTEDLNTEGTVTWALNQIAQDRDAVEDMYDFDRFEKYRLVEAYLDRAGTQSGQTETDTNEPFYLEGASNAQLQELWKAVRADFDAGTIGVRYLFDDQQRQENTYVTDLVFVFEVPSRNSVSEAGSSYSTDLRITLTPNAENTLAWLTQYAGWNTTVFPILHE